MMSPDIRPAISGASKDATFNQEGKERELEGQVWLITGASRLNGIGAAITRTAGREGARLSLTATEASASEARQLLFKLHSDGIEAIWTPADLTQKSTAEELVTGTVAQYGRLDVLVNNAGRTFDMFFTETTDKEWLAGFEVNLRGPASLARTAFKQMSEQTPRGGSILFMSSVSHKGMGTQSIYSSMKAAQLALVGSIAMEGRRYRIRANAISPGLVLGTNMTQGMTDRHIERILELTSSERPATHEEVAEAVVFAASQRSAGMSGETLYVLGGEQYDLRDRRGQTSL